MFVQDVNADEVTTTICEGQLQLPKHEYSCSGHGNNSGIPNFCFNLNDAIMNDFISGLQQFSCFSGFSVVYSFKIFIIEINYLSPL